MRSSPSSRTRSGAPSGSSSEEYMNGSQYCRIRSPISAPGPTLVIFSLSSDESMAALPAWFRGQAPAPQFRGLWLSIHILLKRRIRNGGALIGQRRLAVLLVAVVAVGCAGPASRSGGESPSPITSVQSGGPKRMTIALKQDVPALSDKVRMGPGSGVGIVEDM